MKTLSPPPFGLARALALLIALHFTSPAQAAAWKVLFYGPLHKPDGVAAAFVNSDPRFAPIGQGSAVWPAQTWVTKAAVDFAAFDAIVIGDPGQPGVDAQLLTQAILNRNVWSPQVTGNVLIISGDPEWHAGFAGAQEYVRQEIVFAAESPAAGPGLYVASGLLTEHDKLAQVLAGFGSFATAHGSGQQVTKLASHPTLDCLSEEDLSGWGSSAHDGFHAWPAAFVPVALVTDSPQQTWTPAPPLPAGYRGLVHVLARAASGSLSRYTVQPVRDCVVQGQPATVTVTLKNAAGAPLSGQTIQFMVESGPNVQTPGGQPNQATRTTDGSGTASWTYTGQTGVAYRGEDLVLATWLNGAPAGCLPVMRSRIQWAPVEISLTATDPLAAEPATPGGTANTGTVTFTRTGDTSEALSVQYEVEGTASRSDDFSLNSDGTVFFAEDVTTATVTITPLHDTLPEAPETVVLRVFHDPACQYAAADPDSAEVTIQSATWPLVTLSVVDGLLERQQPRPRPFAAHRRHGRCGRAPPVLRHRLLRRGLPRLPRARRRGPRDHSRRLHHAGLGHHSDSRHPLGDAP